MRELLELTSSLKVLSQDVAKPELQAMQGSPANSDSASFAGCSLSDATASIGGLGSDSRASQQESLILAMEVREKELEEEVDKLRVQIKTLDQQLLIRDAEFLQSTKENSELHSELVEARRSQVRLLDNQVDMEEALLGMELADAKVAACLTDLQEGQQRLAQEEERAQFAETTAHLAESRHVDCLFDLTATRKQLTAQEARAAIAEAMNETCSAELEKERAERALTQSMLNEVLASANILTLSSELAARPGIPLPFAAGPPCEGNSSRAQSGCVELASLFPSPYISRGKQRSTVRVPSNSRYGQHASPRVSLGKSMLTSQVPSDSLCMQPLPPRSCPEDSISIISFPSGSRCEQPPTPHSCPGHSLSTVPRVADSLCMQPPTPQSCLGNSVSTVQAFPQSSRQSSVRPCPQALFQVRQTLGVRRQATPLGGAPFQQRHTIGVARMLNPPRAGTTRSQFACACLRGVSHARFTLPRPIFLPSVRLGPTVEPWVAELLHVSPERFFIFSNSYCQRA